jgi:hypothetical protein
METIDNQVPGQKRVEKPFFLPIFGEKHRKTPEPGFLFEARALEL